MATGSAEYEEVLGCLGSLITQKVRADTGNRCNQWELMAKYVQVGGRRCVSRSVRVWLSGLVCDLGVVALSDTGTGGAHREVEGGSRCRDQREGKRSLLHVVSLSQFGVSFICPEVLNCFGWI